jgi:hypothetical protein
MGLMGLMLGSYKGKLWIDFFCGTFFNLANNFTAGSSCAVIIKTPYNEQEL